jgi:Mycotoxin biosynthesis protein UstYa
MRYCTEAGVLAYISPDHPRTWDVGPLPPIRMYIEPTKHYPLSGPNADAEWAALTPHNGIIHLGPHRQPYSISLFHQLRCLDIIRRDIVGSLPPEGNKLSRHCLNYMRQMVLCRADLAVDPILGRDLGAEVHADTNQCVDWRRVYRELEKNQQEYVQGSTEEHVSRFFVCTNGYAPSNTGI